MDRLPVYEVVFDDSTLLTAISLVEYPAVESNFQYFNKEKKYFAVNDEQRKITGCVLRADFPIYRIDNSGYEYYLTFGKDVIAKLAEKYLTSNLHNSYTLEHSYPTDGLKMIQWFIKDTEKGINPIGFEDISDGSLFATFQVYDDNIWNDIKEGTFKGFSVEAWLDIVIAKNKEENKNKMSKMQKIKNLLRSALMEFGEVSTDKGLIGYDGDEVNIGDSVWGIDEDGNHTDLEDGEYVADEYTLVVAEGKVTEIRPKVEELPADSPVEETPAEELEDEVAVEEEPEPAEDKDKIIEGLKAEIAEKDDKIAELEKEIEELKSKTVAEPTVEVFKKENQKEKSKVKGLERLNRIINA